MSESSLTRRRSFFGPLWHGARVALGALALTTLMFLVLPLIQAIAQGPRTDTILRDADTAALPPPVQQPDPEPEPEPEPDEPPPQLADENTQVDLGPLELMLDGGGGTGWGSGTIAVGLGAIGPQKGKGASTFSLAELDQRPRPTYQPNPVVSAKLRKKAPATVWLLLTVDERGRVDQLRVQKSTDPAFERSALQAVKKWRFEPGKRKGKSVRYKLRYPVTFPKK